MIGVEDDSIRRQMQGDDDEFGASYEEYYQWDDEFGTGSKTTAQPSFSNFNSPTFILTDFFQLVARIHGRHGNNRL